MGHTSVPVQIFSQIRSGVSEEMRPEHAGRQTANLMSSINTGQTTYLISSQPAEKSILQTAV